MARVDMPITSMTLDLDKPTTGQEIIDAVKKTIEGRKRRSLVEKPGKTPGTVIIGQSSGFHSSRLIIGADGTGTEENDYALHPEDTYTKVRISPHSWPESTYLVHHSREVYDQAIIEMLEALAGELLDV